MSQNCPPYTSRSGFCLQFLCFGSSQRLIQLMIRKISQKALFGEQKPHRMDIRHEENEYYLPQPNVKSLKTTCKQTEVGNDKQKLSLKYSRKSSQNGSLRMHSITQFNKDPTNQSKDQASSAQKQVNARLKVQNRKIRSTSHSDALQLLNSKSSLKLQLANRKNVGIKRINLKLESPLIKKEKVDQNQAHFDSYYNNDGAVQAQSRTVRTQNRQEYQSPNQTNISRGGEFSTLYSRCFRLIEDYQQQLQQAKRENQRLTLQNRRLRGERITS